MRLNDHLKNRILPRRIEGDEQQRIAGILAVSASAVLVGLVTLLLFRLTGSGQYKILPFLVMIAASAASVLLLRRGRIAASANVLAWSLLCFLNYMLANNEGLHDAAVMALPGMLVFGGLVLNNRQFHVYTVLSLVFIVAIGHLEMFGFLQNQHYGTIRSSMIVDYVVILAITSLTIRMLSSNLLKSLTRAREQEKELRAHAEEMDESERRYRALFEGANDAILILEEDQILQCNAKTLAMFGCAAESELSGRSFWELSAVHQSDGGLSTDKGRELLAAIMGGTPQRLSWMLTRCDGTCFEAEVSLSLVDSGNEVFIQVVVRDVTDQRRLEAQLRRTQRLESLGSLAGGIAHDLNNVLTPIMMSLDLLRRKVADPQLKKHIASLETSAQRGSDIVKQVLLFARGSEKQYAPQKLQRMVTEMASIVEQTFPRNITLTTELADDLCHVMGDQTQIHQVLMNLCVNARDAMPNGGRLTITASNLELTSHDMRMRFNGTPGEYVVVSISDTGSGIPREIQERIFEPFFTTKGTGKGTGLGLSTVYAIVKDHKGYINLYSEPGKGTSFHVYFPAVRDLDAVTGGGNGNTSPDGRGETVLLVDDEPAVLEITKEILEVHGYRVITANDGAEAVAAFAASPAGGIDLVISDVNMPGMDGPAVIDAVRKQNAAIKTIIVSGLVADLVELNSKKIPIHGYLMKPYTAERLLATIHDVLH